MKLNFHMDLLIPCCLPCFPCIQRALSVCVCVLAQGKEIMLSVLKRYRRKLLGGGGGAGLQQQRQLPPLLSLLSLLPLLSLALVAHCAYHGSSSSSSGLAIMLTGGQPG